MPPIRWRQATPTGCTARAAGTMGVRSPPPHRPRKLTRSQGPLQSGRTTLGRATHFVGLADSLDVRRNRIYMGQFQWAIESGALHCSSSRSSTIDLSSSNASIEGASPTCFRALRKRWNTRKASNCLPQRYGANIPLVKGCFPCDPNSASTGRYRQWDSLWPGTAKCRRSVHWDRLGVLNKRPIRLVCPVPPETSHDQRR